MGEAGKAAPEHRRCAHPRVRKRGAEAPIRSSVVQAQQPEVTPLYPSYSKPILSSTWYATISPSWTTAVDFTTSTVWMLRTVFDAVATARRAASLHDLGLVPTISRMMITPIGDL